MLKLQDQINTQVNPNWKTAEQDWLTAIFVECGEAVESYGYKWWKKQTPDMDNVRLELVDIWHFIMSFCIEEDTKYYPDDSENYLVAAMHEAFSETYDDYSVSFNFYIRCMNAELLERDFYDAWMSFAYLCDKAELSWEQLYSTYIGKNALNAFRANNGYKEGTYVKIWGGNGVDTFLEDNYFLMEYLKTVDLTQVESLYDNAYNYLQSTYRTVQGN